MNPIKAIIVDDEKNALEVLEWLLATYCPEVELIGIFQSGEEVLEAISNLMPDVLFLDVEMPKMNGLELIEKLPNRDFDLVFTTAYDQFAIKAFKLAALNYLLKPIDPEELMTTVARIKAKKTVIQQDQLEMILQSFTRQAESNNKIAVHNNDSVTFVDPSDILYCKADSNYTTIHLEDESKVLIAKTLKEVSETLNGKDFYRVHKSYLVNLGKIVKFIKDDGGYLVMKDGQQISVSRDRKEEFFQLFSRF